MHHSMCETLGKLPASETYDVLMCSYNPLPINFVLKVKNLSHLLSLFSCSS